MVFVLDTNRKPLAPCHPARARVLLKKGKAAVFRHEPFTIILNREVNEEVKPFTLKIDPGSYHTGISIVREVETAYQTSSTQEDPKTEQSTSAKTRLDVVFLAQIDHHQQTVTNNLKSRAAYRRSRRNRKTRYRKVRFNNRKKPKGWLPPSIRTVLQNIITVVKRLMKLCPIDLIQYELVKFDTQLMQNPDIKGKEYQEGPLYRTTIRAFLRKTFNDTCQYCGSTRGIMEWEHIIPRSRGGSNALSNATLACHDCNQEKDNRTAKEWKKEISSKSKLSEKDKCRLAGIENVLKQNFGPALSNAGRINSIRWAIWHALKDETGLKITCSSAGHTRQNRVLHNLGKDHCIDSVCVGDKLPDMVRIQTNDCLLIEAKGRGSHCRTNVDKSGFPVSYLPRKKEFSFEAEAELMDGDFVKAIISSGKNKGEYEGKLSIVKTKVYKMMYRQKPFFENGLFRSS